MNINAIAPRLKGLIKIGKNFVAANRPEILFGTSVVSTVAACGLSAKAGYKSGEQVTMLQHGIEEDHYPQVLLDRKQIAEMTWKNYVPAGAVLATSLGATTGLHLVHVKEKKQIALAAMSAIDEVKRQADQYAEDIAESVKDVLNPSQEEKDEINEKLMERNADRNGGIALVHDTDGVVEELYLCRDAKTGRDIWSNEARIESAMNDTNAVILSQGDCELNLFYSMAGYQLLPDGDDWGWSGNPFTLRWDTTVRDDGRPVRRFTFQSEPEKGYNSAHR